MSKRTKEAKPTQRPVCNCMGGGAHMASCALKQWRSLQQDPRPKHTKAKRKPKVVEAKRPKARACWYLLDRNTGDACWRAPNVTAREAAAREREGMGFYALMVPADPHAKLKADVVRAAVRHYVAHGSRTHSNTCDVCEAVAKLQKVKP